MKSSFLQLIGKEETKHLSQNKMPKQSLKNGESSLPGSLILVAILRKLNVILH